MNNTISNPKGKDKVIQTIQTHLFNALKWNNMEVFGRVFSNPSGEKGNVLEGFKNGEYVDIFTNDLKNANIFFIEDDKSETEEGIIFFSNVKIVFMVDLSKIFPGSNHRMDGECEIQAMKEVVKHKSFVVNGIEIGVPTVFKGYNTTNLKSNGMHPFHVFAITGKLKFQLINC